MSAFSKVNEARKFIAEVQKHECLWKMSHTSYGDKDVKASAWQEVLEELYPEWDTLSLEEKMTKGNDANRRWKNMRDSFKKELNKQQLANLRNVEKRKKYKYFDDLQFLLPQSSSSQKIVPKTHSIKQEYYLMESDESDSNYKPPQAKRIHLKKEKKPSSVDKVGTKNVATSLSGETNKKTESFEEVFINFSSNFAKECQPENIRNSCIGTESFEDVAFFMSLVPSVQKLNDDQKLAFRMEVLNALKNVRDNLRDGYS